MTNFSLDDEILYRWIFLYSTVQTTPPFCPEILFFALFVRYLRYSNYFFFVFPGKCPFQWPIRHPLENLWLRPCLTIRFPIFYFLVLGFRCFSSIFTILVSVYLRNYISSYKIKNLLKRLSYEDQSSPEFLYKTEMNKESLPYVLNECRLLSYKWLILRLH